MLELTENQRLTSLNAEVFANILKLTYISLVNNDCINEDFRDEEVRIRAPEEISKKCGFDEFDSVKIACEGFFGRGRDSCDMRYLPAINATNFVVAELRDDEIGIIVSAGNKNIEYLPYKIHMQFPNLVEYAADDCSIKQISKENFEKLNRLQKIFLSSNKIQKISGNTFKGLETLARVDLSEFFTNHC